MSEPRTEPIVDASCGCAMCTARTTEMYDLRGGCSNCGQTFTVRSRKGDKAPMSVECPACEVTVYGWRAVGGLASLRPPLTPQERSDLGSEFGRLLAERDRLLASGVDPADLEAPLRPEGPRE